MTAKEKELTSNPKEIEVREIFKQRSAALDAKLKNRVPEWLEANGCMPADGQVAIELLARRFSFTLPAAA